MKMHNIRWVTNEDGGLLCQTIKFPPDFWPVTVQGGSESGVYTRQYLTSISHKVRPVGAWSFIGLEQGDIVEIDLNIESEHGIPLVLTSWHKEVPTAFPGWVWTDLSWYTEPVQILHVLFRCRVTNKNRWVFGGRKNELSAVFHAGIRIIGRETE